MAQDFYASNMTLLLQKSLLVRGLHSLSLAVKLFCLPFVHG